MTKFKIPFLFLWILSFWQLPAQAVKVEYQVKAKQSLSKPAFTEPFLLLIKPGGQSLFISKNKLTAEVIIKSYWNKLRASNPNKMSMSANDPAVIKAGKYKNKYKVIVKKDFNKQQFKYQQNAFMSVLQYKSQLPQFKWRLSDLTKTLLDYEVKKATLNYKGRHYTAWYAPAIAISDGPFKFWGLPGLIFEIYDDDNDYHFTVSGIEFPKQITFPEQIFSKNSGLMPVLQTTEKRFKKDFKKTFNADNVIGSRAYIGKDSENLKRERVKRIKSKYDNPIELTNE